jgi:hypothetical protein
VAPVGAPIGSFLWGCPLGKKNVCVYVCVCVCVYVCVCMCFTVLLMRFTVLHSGGGEGAGWRGGRVRGGVGGWGLN